MQFVNGDLWGDAPSLAAPGEYGVGVTTTTWQHPNQLDVISSLNSSSDRYYTRPLCIETWYPTSEKPNPEHTCDYQDFLGRGFEDPNNPPKAFSFLGRAQRDAQMCPQQFPLLIVSHGYPGSRYLLSYLCENLASKGYVVVAIDHTDSTHGDLRDYKSTLMHRSRDVRFVLEQVQQRHAAGEAIWQSTQYEITGLVGYSMGGYGMLNVAGAGYSERFVHHPKGLPAHWLADLAAANEEFTDNVSPHIKAMLCFAPYGAKLNAWDAEAMAKIKIPSFYVCGDLDDISGYEDGVKMLFEQSTGCDRYLLTYSNCRHNSAPNPPPEAAMNSVKDFWHYAEPSWDMRRLNNINQHFASAFFAKYLLNQDSPALDLINDSNAGTYSQEPGQPLVPGKDYWWGFNAPTAVGMRLDYSAADSAPEGLAKP